MLVLDLGHSERIEHLLFSPDGGLLVAPCANGGYVWRAIADGQRAEMFVSPVYANTLRFTSDGRWLFASRSELFRIDLATGESVASGLWNNYSLRFDVSPTEPLLIVTYQLPGRAAVGTRVALWRADDLTAGGKVWERELSGNAYQPPHFLPGGEQFVRFEGGWVPERYRAEYRIITYDTASGEMVRKSDTIPRSVSYAHFSPDGSLCALRDTNHLDIWPVAPGAGKPVRVRNDNKKHFTDAAFHPGGKYIAATSNDWTVKLFDTATWREARTFTWDIGRMRSIAFSPDGAIAAAGTDKGKVIVWDVDL